MITTKSDLLRLRKCANWFWLKMHSPSSLKDERNLVLIEEGDHFEIVVRELFSHGRIVRNYGEDAVIETNGYIANREGPIFQATFIENEVLVRADVLVPVETDAWDLFEIKASTETKEQYLIDLAIQRAVLQAAGLKLRKCGLIIADRSYVRESELEVPKLAWIDDLTAQSAALIETEVKPLIAEARRVVELSEIPIKDIADLTCVPNGPEACGCTPVSYADLPDYSVFDLTRLSREASSKLLRKGVRLISQITPKSIKLTRQQAIQVVLTQQETRKINLDSVAQELNSLKFPLYFLDYETFNFAVPPLPGFRPYQQYVFQYSLHVLTEPGSNLEHSEFLAEDVSLESVKLLCESLRRQVHADGGSVVVWHRSFEESRNTELGQLFPEHESFFRDLNLRINDLEDIFKNGHYLDYRFRGRSSIKVVLPVLCPRFRYDELNVQNGGQAMTVWKQFVDGALPASSRRQTRRDLLQYCELDTLAMVEIYRKLRRELKDGQN